MHKALPLGSLTLLALIVALFVPPARAAFCGPGWHDCEPLGFGCCQCEAGTFSGYWWQACDQCKGGSASSAGASTCSPCDAGTAAVSGSPTCAPCPENTFSNTSGAAECSKCPRNQHTPPGEPRTGCVCDEGFDGETCWTCAAGFEGTFPSGPCTPCRVGFFKSISGPGKCSMCPPRHSTASNGSASEELCLCEQGSVKLEPGGACLCEAGYEGTDPLQLCRPCEEGFWKDSRADAACTKCPPRRSTQRAGSVAREECVCWTGSEDSAHSADVCLCSMGYEGTDPGLPCRACGEGAYKHSVGDGPCSACDCLMTTEGRGSTDASQCVCARGAEPWAGAGCAPCPVDTYKDGIGDDVCSACPANSESVLGSTNVTACACAPGHDGPNGGPCVQSVGPFKVLKNILVGVLTFVLLCSGAAMMREIAANNMARRRADPLATPFLGQVPLQARLPSQATHQGQERAQPITSSNVPASARFNETELEEVVLHVDTECVLCLDRFPVAEEKGVMCSGGHYMCRQCTARYVQACCRDKTLEDKLAGGEGGESFSKAGQVPCARFRARECNDGNLPQAGLLRGLAASEEATEAYLAAIQRFGVQKHREDEERHAEALRAAAAAQAEQDDVEKARLLVLEALEEGQSVPCPTCGVPTRKHDGCMHMTCACQTRFCYVCGADRYPGQRGRVTLEQKVPCGCDSPSASIEDHAGWGGFALASRRESPGDGACMEFHRLRAARFVRVVKERLILPGVWRRLQERNPVLLQSVVEGRSIEWREVDSAEHAQLGRGSARRRWLPVEAALVERLRIASGAR